MRAGKRGLEFNIGYDIISDLIIMEWSNGKKKIRAQSATKQGWRSMCGLSRHIKMVLLADIEKNQPISKGDLVNKFIKYLWVIPTVSGFFMLFLFLSRNGAVTPEHLAQLIVALWNLNLSAKLLSEFNPAR